MVENRSANLPIFKLIFPTWKMRFLAAFAGIGYWLVYFLSGGWLFYSQIDFSKIMAEYHIPSVRFIPPSGGLFGLYNAGFAWNITGHLELNLIYGPLLFSVLLAVMFSISVNLMVVGLRASRFKKAGSMGILAIIPAIFSGGCCSIPIGAVLFGALIPSGVLYNLVWGYPFITNLIVALLMVVSIVYTKRKLLRICPS